MEVKAKCPYCKNEFDFAYDLDGRQAATQTCPHCEASIDAGLLLALRAGGFGAPEIKPVRSLHTK